MGIKKVTVIGGGVLGSQIAYQTAYSGYDVTIYMRSEGSIGRTKPKMAMWHDIYLKELNAAKEFAGTKHIVSKGLIPDIEHTTVEDIDRLIASADKAYNDMKYELDLAASLKDADLVIESMAEDPVQFVQYTGKGGKYLALHFANSIWHANTAEVMGHAGTDQAVYDTAVKFAKSIHMVPLCLHKEQPGYILNSMLVPFLNASEQLWANDVADPQTIDLTWKLGTGAPKGPFEIIDVVGLTTVYNIGKMHPGADDPNTVQGKLMLKLKEKIDKGETGRNAGKGFYDYTK